MKGCLVGLPLGRPFPLTLTLSRGGERGLLVVSRGEERGLLVAVDGTLFGWRGDWFFGPPLRVGRFETCPYCVPLRFAKGTLDF